MAQRQQSQGIEARRGQLQGEFDAAVRAGTQATQALKTQDQGEQQRLERLQQRITQRVTQARNRRQALQGQRRQSLASLASEQTVRRSVNRLPLAEGVLAARTALVDSWRQRVQRLTQCQGQTQTAEHKLVAIEREAGQAALKAEELALRFGLTGKLPPAPCKSDGLPGTIVPTCDLPDQALVAVLEESASCGVGGGWMFAAAAALLSFVGACVLGGSLLRPPKLQ